MALSLSATTRLQHQHEVIHDLIRGLTEQQLKQRTIPDKWSAFEQLVHLTAYQPAFSGRLRKIEQEEVPEFTPYVAEQDPLFHDTLQKSLPEILGDFKTQRFIIINHLLALPDQTLRRTGRHATYGLYSIMDWTEFFLLHEGHHLFKLLQLTGALRNLHQS